MPSRRQQIGSLTGVRGAAACWVMLMHFREVTPTRVWQFPILDNIIANGVYGVDVFFVLSGFVISYAYEASFSSKFGWNDVYQFLAYRFARIYPVHLATFAFMALLFVGKTLASGTAGVPDRYDPITLLASLTLTHDWIPGGQTPNMPAWSVSAEWFAYILFPSLCFVLSRVPWSILAFIVTGLGFAWLWPLGAYGPAHVLSGFLLGMAAYGLWPKLGWISGIRIAGPMVAAGISFWAWSPEPPMAIGLSLFAFLMVILPNPKDYLSRVLSCRGAVYVGEISYSLYMVHWPVRVAIRYALDSTGQLDLIRGSVLVFLYVFVTFIVAVASYRYVEIPGRAALRRIAGSTGLPRVSPAVSTGG